MLLVNPGHWREGEKGPQWGATDHCPPGSVHPAQFSPFQNRQSILHPSLTLPGPLGTVTGAALFPHLLSRAAGCAGPKYSPATVLSRVQWLPGSAESFSESCLVSTAAVQPRSGNRSKGPALLLHHALRLAETHNEVSLHAILLAFFSAMQPGEIPPPGRPLGETRLCQRHFLEVDLRPDER